MTDDVLNVFNGIQQIQLGGSPKGSEDTSTFVGKLSGLNFNGLGVLQRAYDKHPKVTIRGSLNIYNTVRYNSFTSTDFNSSFLELSTPFFHQRSLALYCITRRTAAVSEPVTCFHIFNSFLSFRGLTHLITCKLYMKMHNKYQWAIGVMWNSLCISQKNDIISICAGIHCTYRTNYMYYGIHVWLYYISNRILDSVSENPSVEIKPEILSPTTTAAQVMQPQDLVTVSTTQAPCDNLKPANCETDKEEIVTPTLQESVVPTKQVSKMNRPGKSTQRYDRILFSFDIIQENHTASYSLTLLKLFNLVSSSFYYFILVF